MALFLSFAALSSLVASTSATVTAVITAPPAVPTYANNLAGRATYETTSPLPLTDYSYAYSAIPEQVNPFAVGRGPQSGYNICNSTTEGPTSLCQTIEVNSLSDFCIWGSPDDNGAIGDVEAAVVGYCAQPGHGTRVMPAGTITGAQFMVTSAYIQVVGNFNQMGINLLANDTGGELDPHGADLAGNPLGGLVYSTALPGGNNKTLVQATSWNNFVGNGIFCMKLCFPNVTSPNYCENKFDLLGCAYNAPASYVDGEFTSCEGELQEVVGTYTSAGQTHTWSQPSSIPATSILPWTPIIPASSNCVTYQSSQLFSASTTSTSSSSSSTSTSSSSSSSSGSSSGSSSSTATNTAGASSTPSSTSKASSATQMTPVGSYVGSAGLVVAGIVGGVFVMLGAL